MRTLLLFVGMLLTNMCCGQYNTRQEQPLTFKIPSFNSLDKAVARERWLHNILKGDKQRTNRMTTPYLTQAWNTRIQTNAAYWVGSITTQSFNHGKMGTYYYWDIQGNLRESKMFLDIAGKNKRGLKLVFPRR